MKRVNSTHANTKAWYQVQVMTPNKESWVGLSSYTPVGKEKGFIEMLGFMHEQKSKHPQDRYRLVMIHETEMVEAI